MLENHQYNHPLPPNVFFIIFARSCRANLGCSLRDVGKIAEAIDAFEKVLTEDSTLGGHANDWNERLDGLGFRKIESLQTFSIPSRRSITI